MYCPKCGHNLNELKKQCREEFDRKHAQYFHNLEAVRSHRGYWRGAWIGIAVDLFLVLLILVWTGGSEAIRLISESSGFFGLIFPLLVLPFVIAISSSVRSSMSVDMEMRKLYSEFKKTWGLPEDAK